MLQDRVSTQDSKKSLSSALVWNVFAMSRASLGTNFQAGTLYITATLCLVARRNDPRGRGLFIVKQPGVDERMLAPFRNLIGDAKRS